MRDIIIFLGPPASGKGTQAEIISSKYNYLYFGIGEELKKMSENDPAFAKQIDKYELAGELVPDEIINKLVEEFVRKNPNPILLDGYPRTIKQAIYLDKLIQKRNLKVFYFEIADNIAIQRTEGRRICSSCDKIYLPPKSLELTNCIECNGKLIQRPDDQKEVVKNRLEKYHALTIPLVQYYSEKGLLTKINAELSIEQVTNQLSSYL